MTRTRWPRTFSVTPRSSDQLAELGPSPNGPPTKKLVSPTCPTTYARAASPVTLWKTYAHRSRFRWRGFSHPETPLLFEAAFAPGSRAALCFCSTS